MQNSSIQSQTLNQILEALDFYRGLIIDTVEHELGSSKNWAAIRSRLLKALGDRGLANRIRIIMEH